MDEREVAWFAVHDALRPGRAVGPPSFDPARQLWEVVARSPKPLGRGRPPVYVIGVGVDEITALGDLATKLSDTSQLIGERIAVAASAPVPIACLEQRGSLYVPDRSESTQSRPSPST